MQVFRGWVGDAVATIETTRSGAVLTCTDTVANEWSEEFSTEALAFLRLASLFQCAGSNWTCGFAVEPQEFERLGNEFFLQVVTQ